MRNYIFAAALLAALPILCISADWEFIWIPRVENPDGWSVGDEIPEATQAQLFNIISGDTGAETLRGAGCDALLRAYNDIRSGTLSGAAAYIRDLRSGNVRVYLIDDRRGLTDVMNRFVGVATTESEGNVYAWPCANARPERAIKLGEKYAADKVAEGSGGWEEYQATLLHEMVHTVDQTLWVPVIDLETTGSGSTRRVVREGGTYTDAYGSDREHFDIEILPNARAAFMEGIANFVGLTWSDFEREDYIYFFSSGGMLAVEHGSETQRLIGRTPDETDTFNDTVYDLYRWDSLPLDALIRNEYFIALLLHYYAKHLPPQADGSDSLDGFEQVLRHFIQTNMADRTVIDLIGSLLDSASFSDRILLTNHRYFVLGAMDLMSNFTVDKEGMRAILGQRVFIPDEELDTLLDEYFGAEGLEGERQAIRRDIGPGMPDLDDSMRSLAERYNLPAYDLFAN